MPGICGGLNQFQLKFALILLETKKEIFEAFRNLFPIGYSKFSNNIGDAKILGNNVYDSAKVYNEGHIGIELYNDYKPILEIAYYGSRVSYGGIEVSKIDYAMRVLLNKLTISQLQYQLDYIVNEVIEKDAEAKTKVKIDSDASSSLSQGIQENISISATKKNAFGGIDFRSMNMLVQPAGSFSGLDFSLPMLSKAEIESFDLDTELADIRNMVKGGIVPSGQRLKEYLAVCFEKGETKDKIDSLILCLADIFELQQLEAREASPEYKEALVIADTRRYVLGETRIAGSVNHSLN